jgi:alpha-glucosidase
MSKDGWLWWKHGVIYQIYPRSFFDINGDGIGDINGIITKLDYLSDLKVDGIWLSPVNTSPMYDFGYDISDFQDIDPTFGTLEDYKNLLKEAHRRNIRVILDLVINHTSHLHPWFIEARSSRDNPKRDWYIWHDGKNGKAPNNWLASFGGRAWEWDDATQQFYYHGFLKEQPDVNWRNPGLRKAMFDMIRYWLDLGVDGFRLDVCNYYMKDAQFRSNPWAIGPHPRPYDMQKHMYDRNQPETHDVLKELRTVLNGYDERMSVGEVWADPPGNPELGAGFYGNGSDELNLAFDFSLIHSTKWEAERFFNCISKWDSLIPEGAWPCYVLNNHDVPRSISRFSKKGFEAEQAKILGMMLLTLRGTPFLYYGDEIGMKDGKLSRKDLVDPLKKYWPFFIGRDPERTPMQWSSEKNAGFTSAKPWLPVNPDFRQKNVEAQSQDASSILNFYKDLISLRREKKALHRGKWIPGNAKDDVMSYTRREEDQEICVVLNFSNASKTFRPDGTGTWKVILSTHRQKGHVYEGSALAPYEATIIEKETFA